MSLSETGLNQRLNHENVKYIRERICNKDSGKDYVFISYKSDDWELVLADIVYHLVTDHGLNVYFDGDFDGHNALWTKQFPENMESPNCKGILAFIDDKYTCSYAALMELLYSQAGCQDMETYEFVKKKVVPINLSPLTQIKDPGNTGLGVGTFDNGEVNIHASDEKDLFEELFKSASDSGILKKTVKPYKKEKQLSKKLCAAMAIEVLASIGANNNPYHPDSAFYDNLAKTIKDACEENVFDTPAKPAVLPEPPQPPQATEPSEPTETRSASGQYVYTLWGQTYTAQKLVNMMHDVFDRIAEKHPEKVAAIAQNSGVSAVAMKSDVDGSRLPPEKMGYFKAKKEHTVDGCAYYVGTSYNSKQAIKQIEKMLEVCGEKADVFVIIESPDIQKRGGGKQGGVKDAGEEGVIGTPPEPTEPTPTPGQYAYTLWGQTYTAKKLVDMMHDVFDLIAAKYPGKVAAIAQNSGVTAVATKSDVDESRLLPNKMGYFKAKREHTVDGCAYYVGTSYNSAQAIKQLEKMLEVCGEKADVFVVTKAPDIQKRGGGKQGIGELLND